MTSPIDATANLRLSAKDEADLPRFLRTSWADISGMKAFDIEAACNSTGGGAVNHDKTSDAQIKNAVWYAGMCRIRTKLLEMQNGAIAWRTLTEMFRQETYADRRFAGHGTYRARVIRITPVATRRGRENAEAAERHIATERCFNAGRAERLHKHGKDAAPVTMSGMALAHRVLHLDAHITFRTTDAAIESAAGDAIERAGEKRTRDEEWLTAVKQEAEEMIRLAGAMWVLARRAANGRQAEERAARERARKTEIATKIQAWKAIAAARAEREAGERDLSAAAE